MGSSSKSSGGPPRAAPGSIVPPGAAPFMSAGFAPEASYQGYAGQPFDENGPVYASFLPKDPTASATGLDQAMLDAIMGISPAGPGQVPRSPPPAAPAAPRAEDQFLSQLKLAMMPEEAQRKLGISPQQRVRAQAIIDAQNKSPTLEGYLGGREELARVMQPRETGRSSR